MQSKVTRKRVSLSILFVAFAAILFGVLFFSHAPMVADAAVQGSIVDYTVTPDKELILDVNGTIGGNSSSVESIGVDGEDGVLQNNGRSYRIRYISVNALQGVVASDFHLMRESYDSSDTKTYRHIYNYATDYFDVIAGGARDNYYDYIVITAKKSTVALSSADLPRFALVLTGSGNVTKTVTVRVRINAVQPAAEQNGIYVGSRLRSDLRTIEKKTDTVSFPITLTNYGTTEIDLNDCLVGRQLFRSSPGLSVRSQGALSDAAKDVAVWDDPVSQVYRVFNDISRYSIIDASCKPLLDSNSTVKLYQTEAGTPCHRFVISTDLDTTTVETNRDSNGNFWVTDSSERFFELSVVLQSLDNENTQLTVYLPIVFSPAQTPKILTEFGMDTELNAGSTDIFTGEESSVAGFKKVRVIPQYLCDFTAGGNNTLTFSSAQKNLTSNATVAITPIYDENNKNIIRAYDVEGLSNGNVILPFDLRYTVGESERPLTVQVPFTVYGAYDLRFDIEGTKAQNYTIKDLASGRLKEDNYQIIDAKAVSLKDDVTNDYATVKYDNGIISITPQNNLFDGETVAIQVDLVDMQGHRISVRGPLTIDMKAGDFFSTWRKWQIILFWVGIGLAALLLILLIIWLFIRSIHKHKIDELETSAPTSAYIIKLNSTIAAAQAQQQRAMQASMPAPQSQMLQLGAGPASTPAPDPNTLALGVTPQMSAPVYSSGISSIPPLASTPAPSSVTYNNATVNQEIYIPISDEELLLRIYEEKFEPRGMLKRTFDKSKDLQQRELEREKERIREDVRNGMSIEEACKSLKQRDAEAAANFAMSTPKTTSDPAVQVDPLIVLLGFDPNDPIIADVKKEEIDENLTNEEKLFKEVEYNNLRLHSELSIIESRIAAIVSANEKTQADVNDATAEVEALSATVREEELRLDDKNTDLAVERRKAAKEALSKEIAELNAKLKADKEQVAGRKADMETGSGLLVRIKELSNEYSDKKEATEALVAASDQELEAARIEAQKAADLAERARRQALLNAQLEILNPMMFTVNTLNDDIAALTEMLAGSADEKDSLKSRVSTLQNELLSTTDPTRINEISAQVKDLNKEISDLDRKSTANTTLKSDKGIEMASVRRKANDYIDKENIEADDVVAAEDMIIGNIALEKLRKQVDEDKAKAEKAIAHWQEICDSLSNNLDASVMESAASVAERVQAAEEALTQAQQKLADMDAAIEACTDDDEKLNLTMEQMTLQEEVNALSEAADAVRAEGIKANLENRTQGESELENAREELAKAQEDFTRATERFHEVSTNVNPLDLITSGSGVISQDRKKIEAENLKKKIKEQQDAIEQAKLQAQIAQQEAERAVAEAQRASEESKAEAERLAQEALEKAEAAREEAERNAREEIERAKSEAEEARRLAEEEAAQAKQTAAEEAERARKEAEEESERMRQEMEESKRLAEEEAAKARKEAEEESERMRQEMEDSKRLAAEEAERARKEAEEETEKARRAAEEETERVRQETEEAKRLAEEEAEKARKTAEEEAQKLAEEDAKRKARIDEKVAKRKQEISVLRGELKTVTEEEQGQALREKFYSMLLALDEDEKTSTELTDLLNKSMDDASHAAELSRYKKLANQKPRRIVKKVTERVNRIPKKKPGAARPGTARPGARPARPGAARPGARPVARPGAARPGARPGVRPSGTRPSGRGPTTRK